jgi:hypothetical protein
MTTTENSRGANGKNEPAIGLGMTGNEREPEATEMNGVRFTPEAVGRRYGVSPETVIGWIEAGLMPATDLSKAGATRRRWRVTEEQIERFELNRSASSRKKHAGSVKTTQ